MFVYTVVKYRAGVSCNYYSSDSVMEIYTTTDLDGAHNRAVKMMVEGAKLSHSGLSKDSDEYAETDVYILVNGVPPSNGPESHGTHVTECEMDEYFQLEKFANIAYCRAKSAADVEINRLIEEKKAKYELDVAKAKKAAEERERKQLAELLAKYPQQPATSTDAKNFLD